MPYSRPLDDEPMQVGARPAERDLQHRVQTGNRRVGGEQQPPPDQRTDPAHHHPQLVQARKGAGCMVSGMAPILALRTDGPWQGASHGLSRSPQLRGALPRWRDHLHLVRGIAVNQVISKRMVKKQQKRWSLRGAHLLLQIRTRVLNSMTPSPTTTGAGWYPDFTHTTDQEHLAAWPPTVGRALVFESRGRSGRLRLITSA